MKLNPDNSIRNHTGANRAGVTIIELLVGITILAVLVSMIIVVTKGLKEKAERIACGENMKNLHVALSAYLTDHQRWPQVTAETEDEEDYWQTWAEVFKEYDLPDNVWMCPTHKRKTKDEYLRYSSYHPMPFDGKSVFTPYKWKMPWVIEIGDNHGKGPLQIWHDGSISEAEYSMDKPATTIKKK